MKEAGVFDMFEDYYNMDCAINSFNFCEAVRKREGKLLKESALFAHLYMLKDTFGETFEEALVEYLKGR